MHLRGPHAVHIPFSPALARAATPADGAAAPRLGRRAAHADGREQGLQAQQPHLTRRARQGSYGTVRLVKLKSSGKHYALKCMLIEQVSKQAEDPSACLLTMPTTHTNLPLIEQIEKASHQNHLINERKVMKELDHPFMPKLYTTFKVSSMSK